MGDGQNPVLDGALPSLPHFPDPKEGVKHKLIQYLVHVTIIT